MNNSSDAAAQEGHSDQLPENWDTSPVAEKIL